VSLNTASLNSLGTFYVEFQLIDGSSTGGNGNSQAIVTNFQLTGGALGSVLDPTLGNVAGSLAGTLTLTDGPTSFGDVADFAQAFSVTNSVSLLTFDLQLTTTGVDTPFPDKFSFLILDGSLNPLPTEGPVGVEFVSADFTSTSPTPTGYVSTGALQLGATVTPPQSSQAIPEPGTLGLLAIGATAFPLFGALRRRRRRSV